MYHSVALLMPDARILVAGGGRPGAVGEIAANGQIIKNSSEPHARSFAHREAEMFSPPYLFDANGELALRPVIADSPNSINYSQSFSVEIGDVPANQITQVVLVRLPSVTHGLNFDQRRVVLSHTLQTQQTLSVTGPESSIDCPPGPYMLFVLKQNGVPSRAVPSVAQIIFVNAPVNNNPPPPSPSGLVATALSNAAVSLTWTAPSGPVHHYELDRKQSASAPFIKLADIVPSTTSFTDQNLTGSVAYLYRVRAVNSSGDSSQPSNIDLATTMSFTDNPLIAVVTVIKAQHINELRVAVNAVRATAGLPQASWTDASLPGGIIKAVHIVELRQNLDQALQMLGLATPLYTDQLLNSGLIMKRAHVEEVRQTVR